MPLAALLLVLAVLWLQRHRVGRAPLFVVLFFILNLLPLLGFINVYYMRFSLVADHWQHVSLLAVVALAAAGWSRLPGAGGWSVARPALAGLVLFACAGQSWRHQLNFKDKPTLWASVVRNDPHSWVGWDNHALLAWDAQDYAAAIEHYRHARQFAPSPRIAAEISYNIALAHNKLQRPEQALRELQQIPDKTPKIRAQIAFNLERLNRDAEAEAAYREVTAEYSDPVVLTRFALHLLRRGKEPEAVRVLEKLIQANSREVDGRMLLANLHAGHGRFDQALALARDALREAQACGNTTIAGQVQAKMNEYLAASRRR